MVPLYKSLVRPIIEYGNAVWSPYLRKHIDFIESVQRHFTKCIIGTKNPADRKCAALQRRCRTISGCRTNCRVAGKNPRYLIQRLTDFIRSTVPGNIIHSCRLEIDFSILN